MANIKVLIASGISQEVADMLGDAPPEMEISFLPEGEQLKDHLSDVEILYGVVSEDALPSCEIPTVGDAAFRRRGTVNVPRLQREPHHTDKQQASVWTPTRRTRLRVATVPNTWD